MNRKLAPYLLCGLAIVASLWLGWQLGWHARGDFDREACIEARGKWLPNASHCIGAIFGEKEP
ncbi:MAG: hypothetical protein ACKOOL_11985 [Novosphingobium sp.]